jgi:Ca2+-binding EF-hand superfamily protein
MADVSLIGSFKRLHQDRYDNYQIGRTDPRGGMARPTSAVSALADETTEPVEPITPEVSPYAGFAITIDAMGMNAFTPNGDAISQINQAMQAVAPAILNPDMAGELLGLQPDTTAPTQEDIDGAMAALGQNYNVEAGPVALFKQIDSTHSGVIKPWDLTRAVMAGGGTIEQASALMKQLDPFSNGYVTVQNMMANLPGVEAPVDTGTSTTPQTDDSAMGALSALATMHDLRQPSDLFNAIDTDLDGYVSQDDVVAAVTAGGGSSEAGAALYAQLDPANTGAVDQAQFDYNLYPRIELPSFFA